ncbi:unnamed protein product [Ixodes persulcatus]
MYNNLAGSASKAQQTSGCFRFFFSLGSNTHCLTLTRRVFRSETDASSRYFLTSYKQYKSSSTHATPAAKPKHTKHTSHSFSRLL